MEKHEVEQLVKAVAKETAQETVTQTFTLLGADIENPLEMQKDFQAMREFRVVRQSVGRKVLLTTIGALVVGVIAAFWVGLKDYLGR